MPVLELERGNLPTPIHSPEIASLQRTVVPEIFIKAFAEKLVVVETPGFKKDLVEINDLQRKFNRALGVDTDEEGIRNYNPVLARWRYETLVTDEEREQFRNHEAKQVETALRERYDSAESSLIYSIDENQRLRNSKIFPTEAFAAGIQRGVAYLRQQGSPDSEREEKEVEGFLKVERVMVDPETPVNTKMMVISPPSKMDGTIYVKNFVDFYELQEIQGKKVVKMTRFASDASYPEELSDAYLLSHPTRIDTDERNVHEIFREKFESKKGALEESKMKEVIVGSQGRIRYFVEALCEGDPESIALSFNAVLNGADMLRRTVDQMKNVILPAFKSVRDEVDWLGRQVVERIAAACGTSSGFSLKKGFKIKSSSKSGSLDALSTLLAGSDEHGSLKFKCENCDRTNIRPRGELLDKCQHCHSSVSC